MRKQSAAVIVTYNRKKLLMECIDALQSQTNLLFDILIIDNNSTDGTKEAVIGRFCDEGVLYFNTGENLGGAGGFNFGIKKAVTLGYDYCWVMDDDTIASDTAFEKLYAAAESLDDAFSFLCSRVKWTDGSYCKMNEPEISRAFSNKYSGSLVAANSCSFVSCFFKTSDVKRIGLPIREFFIYGDDVEFTKRLRKLSEAYLVEDSIVVHKMSSNNGASIVKEEKDRIDRYWYLYRNVLYTARKTGKGQTVKKVGRAVRDGFCVLLKSKNLKIKRLEVIIKGTVSGIFFAPKIEMPE